ncbi:HAUS augmin-like complex subunit 7 [Pezoporus flaviventris]|uniref:HAUS augmin-like complex subunit 7 n=1 Tax=Pezoporus flaviventris TaxID=889875 RepID=UPI002AAFCDF3|nr:HAUS augmin-like complex subunit 7 [Pezoporus flaviventris]
MAAEAAAAVVARLRALPSSPPGLEAPLEPGAALRLLCTPSRPRLALLEWICCRVNPPLAKRLDELRHGPERARLRELAALAEELMLSEAEDTALVEGTAPPEQQLGFIRDLLDAAPSREEEEENARSSILLRASTFLQEVLESPEGVAVLNPPPLSPSPGTPPGNPPPRLGELELEAELGEAQKHLEMMEAEVRGGMGGFGGAHSGGWECPLG